MQKDKKEVFVVKEEYHLFKQYLKRFNKLTMRNKLSFLNLNRELSKAVLVDKDSFPPDIVRLNSTVIVKDRDTNRVKTYTIVSPDKVDDKESKVSILSPIGIALIGFKKGLQFTWRYFSSKHNLTIMEVYNSPSLN